MSHPPLVRSIESAFVPVAIFNNRPGKDAEILKRFGEPAWNYQVVRFLDHEANDILPRKDRVWTLDGIAARMRAALKESRRPVPVELETLVTGKKAASSSGGSDEVSTAHFAMDCFWEGEARLGRLDGVLSTEAGWLEGHEVVKVDFLSEVIPVETLVKEAEAVGCAHRIFVSDQAMLKAVQKVTRKPVKAGWQGYRKARESDQKVYLARSEFTGVPLSDTEKTKVNAALRFGQDPRPFIGGQRGRSGGSGNRACCSGHCGRIGGTSERWVGGDATLRSPSVSWEVQARASFKDQPSASLGDAPV